MCIGHAETKGLINKVEIKEERFSIIEDIKKFSINYNKKYWNKLDFYENLQGDEDNNNIIIKVCDYVLEIIYENNPNYYLDESIDDSDLNEDEHCFNEYENQEENEEMIELNEIFPKIKPKRKKKINYIDTFGLPNDLKKFWENLALKIS